MIKSNKEVKKKNDQKPVNKNQQNRNKSEKTETKNQEQKSKSKPKPKQVKNNIKQKGGSDISSNPIIYSASFPEIDCTELNPTLNMQGLQGSPYTKSYGGSGINNVISDMNYQNINLSNYNLPYSSTNEVPSVVHYPSDGPFMQMASGSVQIGGAKAKKVHNNKKPVQSNNEKKNITPKSKQTSKKDTKEKKVNKSGKKLT